MLDSPLSRCDRKWQSIKKTKKKVRMRGADREGNEIIMRGDGSGHAEHHLRYPPPLPPLVLMSRLVSSQLSHPTFLYQASVSQWFNFSCFFLDSRREVARRGERHWEECAREGTLSSSGLYKAISVPVKLRRLSSSPSVELSKCLFSLALFPVSSFSERNSESRV